MTKNKYEFIKELLESKKLEPNQRERILELAAKEVHADGNLEERVTEIEKIVFKDISAPARDSLGDINRLVQNNKDNHVITNPEVSELPKYINPSWTYKFLFEYNQNKVLKSTCHDIDRDEISVINEYCKSKQYDFQKHLREIIKAYEIHEKKHPAPFSVKALIRGYLTGKDYSGNELKEGWSADKIKIYWSHPKLISWAEINPGHPPNPSKELIDQNENVGYEFDRFVSKVTDSPIQNFRELVIHFKHLFHLRNDNSLHEFIESKNRIEKWTETIDFNMNYTNFPKNIEHFTDIDKLIQAYKKIIVLIIEQHSDSSKPSVKLTFSENKSALKLSIHHLNSTYNKTIQNTIERIGSTYSSLIKYQLNGMCNLYLNADFGQGNYAYINLWDGNERKVQQTDQITGVEHIFEFPK